MTDKTGKEIYRLQVERLVDKIEKIRKDKTKSEAEKSKDIMEHLINESLRIPLEYVNSFMYSRKQVELLLDLTYSMELADGISKEEIIELGKKYLNSLKFYEDATINPSKIVNQNSNADYIILKGNSFGPFNPEEYFKEGNFRILWLLKEPIIKKESWVKGDRGGHDQADDNREWETMEENKTLENLIHRTQEILDIVKPKESKEIGYSEQETMDHICILEVNHFPGLAFQSPNSNDGLIGKWAKLNEELIKKLIEFYDPQIIIGGKTLDHFFPDGYKARVGNRDHSFANIRSGILGPNKLKSFNVLGLSCIDCIGDDEKTTKNYIFKTKENRFLIDAYHPSSCCYKKDYATEEGKIIKQWIEGDEKTG